MAAVLSLLIIVSISLIVTKIATVILVHTGLSRESAKFQARSAFTGVGFTTHESESVVTHPVRRRVTLTLMLLGNAGIVSAMATLLLTFLDHGPSAVSPVLKLLALACGLAVLGWTARSRTVDRWLSRWTARALERWTDITVRDYSSLLHMADNHEILEMAVDPGDWMADKTLSELALSDEGVIVIGIQRPDGNYIGAPHGRTRLNPDDTLVLYGRDSVLKELDQRCCGAQGDAAHRTAVARHREELNEQPSDDASATPASG